MKEGMLYLKSNTADMTEKQWIVNKEDQMKVILSCHDGKLGGGHFGRDKTLQKICSQFYCMARYDKAHKRICKEEIDRYLATCTDYFSKWPEAQALPTKSAEGVAHFLLSLITWFGCFSVCISDQGREFVNALNDKHQQNLHHFT
ncbi:hypothetical protein EMCRGX_G022999 [Ephydatia muelleri]